VSRFFKLVGKVAVPVSSEEYFQWIMGDPDHGSRKVRADGFLSGSESIQVSTVFIMGINHRWMNEAEPLLFETMVFGGTMDQAQWRYSTWEKAEAGHQMVIEKLLQEMPHLTKVAEVVEPAPPRLTRYERIIRECQSLKS
jgi:hypothetical protein